MPAPHWYIKREENPSRQGEHWYTYREPFTQEDGAILGSEDSARIWFDGCFHTSWEEAIAAVRLALVEEAAHGAL